MEHSIQSVKVDTCLEVKLHSKDAHLPTQGSPDATGYDLYSAKDKIIPSQGKALIDTQISIASPPGTYGQVTPRSGLAPQTYDCDRSWSHRLRLQRNHVRIIIQSFKRRLPSNERRTHCTINPGTERNTGNQRSHWTKRHDKGEPRVWLNWKNDHAWNKHGQTGERYPNCQNRKNQGRRQNLHRHHQRTLSQGWGLD